MNAPAELNPAAVTVVTHELRNTLAPLQDALDIIASGEVEPEVVEQMTALAQRQVRRMGRLLHDLLDASRVASGGAPLQLANAVVQDTVNEAVLACGPSAALRQHAVTVTMPRQPLHARLDALRMHQVIVNLLANAIKYTPAGGHLAVEVTGHGASATVAISDDGIGIEPNKLERMFEFFEQDPRAHALSPDGLGIGLAVARRLTEQHGGFLTAFSDGPGRGSRFTITLPLHS